MMKDATEGPAACPATAIIIAIRGIQNGTVPPKCWISVTVPMHIIAAANTMKQVTRSGWKSEIRDN